MYSTAEIMDKIGVKSRTTLYKRMDELNIFPLRDEVGRLQFTDKHLDKLKRYVPYDKVANLRLQHVSRVASQDDMETYDAHYVDLDNVWACGDYYIPKDKVKGNLLTAKFYAVCNSNDVERFVTLCDDNGLTYTTLP